DASLKSQERVDAIGRAVGSLSTVAANRLAEELLGNTIYSNVLMLGFAWQHGLIPVSLEALLKAIELNGVEVEKNKEAFGWGRIAAADRAFVAALLTDNDVIPPAESLDSIVSRRAAFLRDYQDQSLSDRYLALVAKAKAAEAPLGGTDFPFTAAVARGYFKTLAYKAEYQ